MIQPLRSVSGGGTAPEQNFSGFDFSRVMEKIDKPGWAVLNRLADVPGVAPEHFFIDASPTGPAASAEECMRWWSEIATEEGRRQALRALRAIVERDRE